MKFSIVIPARNEEGCVGATLQDLTTALDKAGFTNFEIVVVADHCTDGTEDILKSIAEKEPRVRWVRNDRSPGFGRAVRVGLHEFSGDAVAIYMADASDSPADLIEYFRKIEAGAECVFGSRFIHGSELIDYPAHKLVLNRLANWFIRLLFRHGLNDTTNAFKCYRREVIEGCRPFLSPHFNLTVELPLKAHIRGYKFEVIPISWQNRKAGTSKLKLKEMGSRYFFIILYCLLEKLLTGNDYHRRPGEDAG